MTKKYKKTCDSLKHYSAKIKLFLIKKLFIREFFTADYSIFKKSG